MPIQLRHGEFACRRLNRFEGTATAAQLIVATTLAVTAASWLIWRYVERPAQKWMKRSLNNCVEQLGGWFSLIRARMERSTAK